MRNFYRVAEGLNVKPLALALTRQPELWNTNKFRTEFENTPHVDVDDILLRFSDTETCDQTGKVIGDTTPIWHEGAKALPEVKPLVMGLMGSVGAYDLGRLLISRVPPGGQILPHADNEGEYVLQKNIGRYHIVVNGEAGSTFRCGDEEVCMRTGEVWWFNAHEIHSVVNNSKGDRIHVLADVYHWPF